MRKVLRPLRDEVWIALAEADAESAGGIVTHTGKATDPCMGTVVAYSDRAERVLAGAGVDLGALVAFAPGTCVRIYSDPEGLDRKLVSVGASAVLGLVS